MVSSSAVPPDSPVSREPNAWQPRDPGDRGTPALEVRAAQKHFGGVAALIDGRVSVHRGEIVALVGDNGAGKSTLAKVIAGSLTPDGGEILVDGQPVELRSPSEAEAYGIRCVYQDLSLCDNLDAVANMFLGHEVRGPWYLGRRIDRVGMEDATKRNLARFGVVLENSKEPVGFLSGGQRQAVAIARAVVRDARAIILDEPTNNLGVTQRQHVHELMSGLRDHGIGIVVISHDLGEVQDLADRIFVMRLGRTVADFRRGEQSTDTLVGLITGTISGLGNANAVSTEGGDGGE